MKQIEIQQKVYSVVEELLGVDEELTPSQKLVDDLGMYSLDKVEFIMSLEKEFNIVIPDDDTDEIETLGQIIAYLEKHVS